jgi:perosamine synthetase
LQHQRLGYNYRLSDINCALGLSQLRRLPEFLECRRRVAERYIERLRDLPELIPPAAPGAGVEISWFVFVVRLQDDFEREERDRILQRLRERGIGCSNYFTPIHLQPFYQERFGYRKGDFPVTEHVSERTIALPFFNRLTEAQVERVCECLKETIREVTGRVWAAGTVGAAQEGL